MKKILAGISTLIFFDLYGQYIPINDIPVIQYEQLITAPLTGGVNAIQLSDVDLNNDGINDAFAFDRGSYVPVPFLKDASNNYTYAPEFQKIFPPMADWALLRDFNCDNIPDLFTYYIGTTKVY